MTKTRINNITTKENGQLINGSTWNIKEGEIYCSVWLCIISLVQRIMETIGHFIVKAWNLVCVYFIKNFVKNWAVGCWHGYLSGADLHMAQLMPLPLTVSCFSKIQTGFTFLVPAHPGSPGQRAVIRVCVCLLVNLLFSICFAIGYIHSGEIKIFIFILTSVGSGLERERERERSYRAACSCCRAGSRGARTSLAGWRAQFDRSSTGTDSTRPPCQPTCPVQQPCSVISTRTICIA